MSSEQRGIGSVEVGGQLLRVLTEAEQPMMLRDLAARAGMTAAKAHPYVVSFMRLGLIEQDRASGRYELGPFALQMGLATMRRLDPVRIAQVAIGQLAQEINQTVYLSVWGNHGPTVVWMEQASGILHVSMRVGSIMSLSGTATGRVFAAYLPPKMIETFMGSGLGRMSVGNEAERAMSRNQLEVALREVRDKGLARAVERPIPGVNAFSAPIFDNAGSIALAITAIGPSHTFDASWDGPIANTLRKSAALVSSRLGFARHGTKAA